MIRKLLSPLVVATTNGDNNFGEAFVILQFVTCSRSMSRGFAKRKNEKPAT